MIVEALAKAVERQNLTRDEAAAVMSDIMEDRATPAQFGAFVTALRLKGETPEEIAGMAQVMRAKSLKVPTDLPVIDTCGTGGDGSGTFNVSTAAAFVVAGAGQPVAKHGNRGMTSKCGSADVLEALGANITLGPDAVAKCIERAGMGFMFAPAYHPAMKFAAPLRREIGIRTVFNILGPLTNPAGAKRQVLGVASHDTHSRLAGALALLGTERALVVHGAEGLDEISLSGPTYLLDVNASTTSESVIRPEQLGIQTVFADALKGGDATENARIVRDVLTPNGAATSAQRDIVALNAAAALVAAGVANDLSAGLARARDVLHSGAGLAALERFVKISRELAAEAMSILDEILAHKRGEVAAAKAALPLDQLLDAAHKQSPARGFARALRSAPTDVAPRLVAEIKKVSPAKGALNPDMDVRAMARLYEKAGAAAISVLTDAKYFSGHLDDLRAVREMVALPVLRKDFVVDAYQLAEARAAGADAALLIVGAFDSALPVIRSLLATARELGLDCLVEVHDEAEMAVALEAGSDVIGVNNRNLKTFEVSLDVTERLAPLVPRDRILVSESGINSGTDAQRVRRAGASAILVGSAIVGSADPAAKVRELVHG